jgi:hypothetical protein
LSRLPPGVLPGVRKSLGRDAAEVELAMESPRKFAVGAAWVAVFVSWAALARGQGCTDPSVCGRWSAGLNLWATHSTCECDGPNFAVPNPCYEIVHVTLISSGPKEAWVLYWRSDPNCGAPTYI